MRTRDLALHAVHVALPLAVLLATDQPLVELATAVVLFFALFTAMHDAMHGALGLPRFANEVLLTFLAALTGASGDATRRLHMHHHAAPFAPDDLEGLGGRHGLLHAIVMGPACFLAAPVIALRRTPRGRRLRQLLEWTLTITWISWAIAEAGALRTFALVCLGAHLSIRAWGAHLPHDVPPGLARLGRALAFTRHPIVLSLVLHEEHHRQPRVPMFTLAERRLVTSPAARSQSGRSSLPGRPSAVAR